LLRDIAYTLVFGKPVVLWLGLATLTLFASAAAVVGLNNYTKIRIPIEWHYRLAVAGLCMAAIHATLALSAYF